MKEIRFFYTPDAATTDELPDGEAQHASRVLRLHEGDDIYLMDGRGTFYEAHLTAVSNHHCRYAIDRSLPQQRAWEGRLSLAMAPTKMMERTEWMAEKATEVGVDSLTMLDCRFSERKSLRQDRLEKIVVGAVKQSRKPWMPVVEGMTPFSEYISRPFAGRKFICHCYDEVPRADMFDRLLAPADSPDVVVMIGPEGDFSIDEVRQALDHGFESVTLGSSRLRTETAALQAAIMMQLARRRR